MMYLSNVPSTSILLADNSWLGTGASEESLSRSGVWSILLVDGPLVVLWVVSEWVEASLIEGETEVDEAPMGLDTNDEGWESISLEIIYSVTSLHQC